MSDKEMLRKKYPFKKIEVSLYVTLFPALGFVT